MSGLQSFQKKYLRGLAHDIKPVVFVGQKGFTPTMAKALDDALGHHELVKVKFIDFKEKGKKLALVEEIEKNVICDKVGLIGHVATFYRRQNDPEKRKIVLPKR